MRRGGPSLFFVIYIVIGLLVAAGVLGDEPNYLSGISNLEEVLEAVLAVLLWPLVLLGVSMDIGGGGNGGGGGGAAGGGGGNTGGGGGG